ncbi:Histidine--tRNA ligase [uncultured delta proteobacterium]|uniref:Histidine--tRNA ligase n=1 Tax=uncultured delta proteobacterium TaxID=34034 RepID=A0A212JYS6_9DELT|nr:Histidine--tRNA ligase [uncultured delta proteobacterium]
MAEFKRGKGFADIFEPESTVFSFMETTARKVFSSYGYAELRTPIMEQTDLFARGIGTETDVVQKEMYTFPDKKGRSMTLRPEATAGVIRAYIEGNCNAREAVSKFFTYGPMFRYERPQKGRMRQFHQLNCECIGASEPQADAELILMLTTFLKDIGIRDLSLQLNSLGCKECRPAYHAALQAFLDSLNPEDLCEDCRRRKDTNPLRVLDCKVPSCKAQTENAPKIIDYNCPDCRDHFQFVLDALGKAGLPYVLNHRLVRGLDYYNRTTFEVVSETIGAQGTVAGGGRYDGLAKILGGPDVPAVGFAAGMERLALMIDQAGGAPGATPPDFYLAVLDEAALADAIVIAQRLREAGKRGEVSFTAKSLKSQMRQASKTGAKKCLLLGGNELAAKSITVKDMETGDQVTVPLDALLEKI